MRAPASASEVSAIVPTYREASRIGATVRALRDVCDEVIVCDAQSPDGSAGQARAAGATVVSVETPGRGAQLNAGAAVAGGATLVFVHADTTIPKGFRAAIDDALSDPCVVGGNFRLRFWPPSCAARGFTFANDLRRRWFDIYYGDSCIFVRTEVFRRLGGFPPSPILEDYAFVRALEALGPTAYITSCEVRSSARRFADHPWRTLALWTFLQAAYGVGVDPHRLAALYRHVR
ncbi:MAG: TIGR04283 family arsenosugar biosynthesis glycosyltransferase [Myxococcota bacterium]